MVGAHPVGQRTAPVKAPQKLAVALTSGVLLVVIVAAMSLLALRQVEAPALARRASAQVIDRAQDLLSELTDAETGARGYVLTGDEAFLEPYLHVRDSVQPHELALRSLAAARGRGAGLDVLPSLVAERMTEITKIIARKRARDDAGALAQIAAGRGKQLMDSIRVVTATFVATERSELAAHEQEYQTRMWRLTLGIIASAVSALILALVCVLLIMRISRRELDDAANRATLTALAVKEETNRQLQTLVGTLQVSEARLAVTLDSIGDGVIATDTAGIVTILNPLAARLCGWPPAEAVGRSMYDVFHIVDQTTRAALPLPLAAALESGTTQLMANHAVLLARGGGECAIADSCAPIRDADGVVVGAVLVFRDVTEEYLAAQTSRDNAARISAILNTVADGICTVRAADGLIQTVNPAIERMFGYAASALVGQPVRSLIPALSDRGLEVPAPSDDAHAATIGREMLGRTADGGDVPLAIAVSEMWIGDERYLTAVLRDISARKQAEAALVKAGALQSAIFNSANFSSIATDATGVIQIFNVGAERMLGYTAAEVMNNITPADISDPTELIARADALSAELRTPILPGFEALVFKASRGIEDIYELTYIRKDKSRFPAVVSVTALRDAQGTIIGYLLIGTDNSARMLVEVERQKLDQRLRDQQFYTRSLIESNIDAIMTTDPRGIITDVNKQTEALTGRSRDELIGAPFHGCFTDPERAGAGISRVLNEGKVTNYELTARARDGTLTVVSYNATTFHDRDRQLQGVFAAARDVTELKRYEQALQVKNVELEGASRMKSELLANMSHELRTPLNAIIGFSEVLRDGLLGDLSDKQRKFVGDIFSSGQHLLTLINDILDLSKVEAGKMALDIEGVNIPAVCANSVSMIREKAAAHHIHVVVQADEALAPLQADARKVKQIVYNLLSNAVKFSTDGGTVTLDARVVARTDVGVLPGDWAHQLFALAPSAYERFLQISVSDSGIGISPLGMERLFKPFSQVDSGLARKFEGTGLGLAMVRQLAELCGGTVAVESAVGAGSCFTVWLPLRAALPDAPASPPALLPIVHTLTGERIALVVEDDDQSAELIRVQLEAEGFTVVRAASAEAALALATGAPPSLITLAIDLPGMDGWEFLVRLKQVPAFARVPVVIISIVADRDRGLALGAAVVMQKPIVRQELYDALLHLGLFPTEAGATLTVLIVDDDPGAVELIAVRLTGLATTILRATGGREAIDIARAELPDLIVLDLMMPLVSGFEVVEALRERPETAAIPILVVTAKHLTVDERDRLRGAVTAVMEKAAFDRSGFVAEVHRALAHHHAAL
jgi:PAS domain S-box-containing protein